MLLYINKLSIKFYIYIYFLLHSIRMSFIFGRNTSRRQPIKKALLIGIDYVNTPARLYGCQNDVKNMRNVLIDTYGYHPFNIKLLTDDTFKPTISNILRAINWLIMNTIPGDVLYLHYSGHGAYVKDHSGDETDGRDEVIIPLDYTRGVITDDLLHRFLVQRVPSGTKLFASFDCCHSGTILDLKYTFKCNSESRVPILPSSTYVPTNWLDKYEMGFEGSKDVSGSVYMFSGCLDEQQSLETVINSQPQGAFTKQLIDCIKSNKGKEIKLIDMLKELNARLKINGFRSQRSQLSVGRLELLTDSFSL